LLALAWKLRRDENKLVLVDLLEAIFNQSPEKVKLRSKSTTEKTGTVSNLQNNLFQDSDYPTAIQDQSPIKLARS
jgi:hypothetical protein